MFTLPDIAGRYPVGATTFAIPLNDPQVIGSGKLRRPSGNVTREPALLLEEVVFTAFYPADISNPSVDGTPPEKLRKSMEWVPKPVRETMHGYAHFAKSPFWMSEVFMSFVASRLKLPVYPNVPLLDRASCSEDPHAQWPLVFFSHGLSGTRTTYSHLCIRLASQGKVVLAMEHRDGTAPVVMSHFASTANKGYKPKVKFYLHPEDVKYELKEEAAKIAFREDQLLFRRMEIYLAYRGFADFTNARPPPQAEMPLLGDVHIVHGCSAHEILKHGPFWSSWTTGRMQFSEDVDVVGHSFGGATVLSILSNPPPSLAFRDSFIHPEALPITHALVLDPWLEPLPTPGPAPNIEATRDACTPHILVLNSEQFTLWTDHFARLQGVVSSWHSEHGREGGREPNTTPDTASSSHKGESEPVIVQAKLLTLIRAKHVSFSDFSVIPPLGNVSHTGRQVLRIIGDLAVAFLSDEDGRELGNVLMGLHIRDMEVEHKGEVKGAPPGRRKRRIVGEVGEVIIH
ncbi:uncharacterized protein LAESUDRAFT_754072 [Laetiporus sulphureus 93-53]|uniref:1-alkyl-2-acetylglycerophosphocholine esterase n=1 Tax=Laetiporus sulphureus 93-53 TaxID=1314785 RepID=A0A165IGS9_9APHY|nr:uncharacterized protein LAESUDRAFT_754072 [Laetiporus sulphureus 93-53]KZT13050.1 hypothetical protein LAESUDRAFT_754072 [Laetiporus sulphureus 93-53]